MSMPIRINKATVLAPAGSIDDYNLHCAALEWGLSEPIVLNSADEIQSRPLWEAQLKPFLHQQQNLFTFCRRLPCTLLADDVGLGKTISAALIISELMSRRRITRTLVLCPKIIAPQWKDELESKFGLQAVVAQGAALLKEQHSKSAVVITTYETARIYIEKMKPDSFDFLILDEAHKLRNLHGSPHPPKTARQIRKVLESRIFKYVLMLTATPMQNRLYDLYSLIDLLTVAKGHSNPFGSPNAFLRQYAIGNAKRVQPNSAQQFQAILRDNIVRTRRSDAILMFPKREVRTLRVQPSPEELTLFQAANSVLCKLTLLSQISVAQALISSPYALISQLRNMINKGTVSTEAATRLITLAERIRRPSKLHKLLQMIQQLRSQRPGDWRLVVFTTRLQTQNMISEALDELEVAHGLIQGSAPLSNQQTIQRFRTSPPAIHVVLTTDAGAEGVNLQSGNVLVNYDLPWNPMVVEQRIGRLQRLASVHETVEVLNLAVAGSVEDLIVVRLIEKLQGIASAIGDIESIIEAADWGNQDDEDHFEGTIAQLVINSLLSQDVSQATELAERSIEKARQLVETQRHELDQLFGAPDQGKEEPLVMPRLSRPQPRMTAVEFVLGAKSRQGLVPFRRDNETVEFLRRGRVEEIANFSQDSLSHLETNPSSEEQRNLYQPGKAAFERLVQTLSAESAHHVHDLLYIQDSDAWPIVTAWVKSIPEAELVRFEVLRRAPRFDGTIQLKVRLANGVDSYEKIIEQQHGMPRHAHECSANPQMHLVSENLRPFDTVPDLQDRIGDTIAMDPDINGFGDYYQKRLRSDLQRAGDDPARRKRVESDLSTSISVDVAGVQGVVHPELIVQVTFTLPNTGSYRAEIGCSPAFEELTFEPRRDKCAHTERHVPADCLTACSVSGQRVLHHLLMRSDKSAAMALPEYFVTCVVSGLNLIHCETLLLDDGRRVDESLVGQSAISKRFALKTDLVRCDFTGDIALADETVVSEVSGRRLLIRDACQSSSSGTKGHRSEFFECSVSHSMLLPCEVNISDLSGATVCERFVERSENHPSRKGIVSEFKRCQITGRRLLIDELGVSSVSGVAVDRNLLFQSAASGKSALLCELEVCDFSGLLFFDHEIDRCGISGKAVDRRLLATCSITGQRVMQHLLVRCDITQQMVLPSVVATCTATGRRVLATLLATCSVTGFKALSSEMVSSARSGRLMLRTAALFSAVSNTPGHPEEMTTCPILQQPVFDDETGRCQITGINVATTLLATCALSGQTGLASHMVVCSVTNQRVLPTYTSECCLTGKQALKSFLSICSVSGRQALADKMVTSSMTNRRMLPESAIRSHVSGRLGHPDEGVICQVSGRQLLSDEGAMCEATGQFVDKTLLAKCDHSGVSILRSMLVLCDETGKLIRPAYTSKCSATGKTVLSSLLHECSVTGNLALPSAMLKSSLSNRWILTSAAAISAVSGRVGHPDEMVTCGVHRKTILRAESGECSITGMTVAQFLLGRCEATGRQVLKSTLEVCALTGKWVLPTELGQCSSSGRKVLLSLLAKCSVTGKLALPEAMIQSAISGCSMLPDAAGKSSVSSRFAHPDEMVTCEFTGQRLLADEAETCSLTGRVIWKALLARCESTGLWAQQSIMVRCNETSKLVIPSETQLCAATGRRMLKSLLQPCSVTQKLALPKAMKLCAVSQRLMIPKFAIQSPISSQYCHPDESLVCHWLQKRILASEADICQLTGLTVGRKFLTSKRELKPLRIILDGDGGMPANDLLLSQLSRLLPEKAGKIQQARFTQSPLGKTLAVSIETRTGRLITEIHYLGLLLEDTASGLVVRGQIAVGKWSRDFGWTQNSVMLPQSNKLK
jgi:superfamily II DNA or RNA helicase